MPSTVSTMVDRTRRLLRDWPDLDTSTASITASGTTLTVADTTLYTVNQAVELESEAMIVRAIPGGTTLTVKRGAYGSTGASHANSTSVLLGPRFYQVDILDALNAGLSASWPLLYQRVVNTTITTTSNTYEYNVPSVGAGQSFAIPYLYQVDIRESGETKYRKRNDWEVVQGATRAIRFKRTQPASATLRLHGVAPYADLTLTGSLDTNYPAQAEQALVSFAASFLLQSAEANRVRIDTGTIDNREQANRVGASAAIAQVMMQRFYRELQQVAQPPPGKHIKAVM